MALVEFDTQFEDVRRYLPPFLCADDKQQLFSEFRRIRDDYGKINYFWLNPESSEISQGDVWRSFLVRRFEDGECREIAGIVLSNSCDIDPANDPDPSQNIVFAPLQSLERYRESLLRRGKRSEQIESLLTGIRRQLVTSMFYLPANGRELPESIVLLDDVHVHPLRDFLARRQERLATLSQVGHYIFLVKLSIHFTRMQEGVRRRNDS
jgi:hypothetical protein